MQNKKNFTYLLLMCSIFIGISCSEEVLQPNTETVEDLKLVDNFGNVQKQERTRRDTPWWNMSDSELADSIAVNENEVLISFKESDRSAGVDDNGQMTVSDETVRRAMEEIQDMGVEISHQYRLIPYVFGKIKPDKKLINSLRNHPLVDVVEPNVRGQFESSDKSASPALLLQSGYSWNVDRVRAPEAWYLSEGSGVKVLIIDSGVHNHTDLNISLVEDECVTNDPPQGSEHGTRVSGILASLNNQTDVTGIASSVNLYSCQAGVSTTESAVIASGIEYARQNNFEVINMSISSPTSSALIDQIKGAYDQDDIVLVSSAGNSSSVTFPANMDEVIAVSATDEDDEFYGGSTGSEIELAAPGELVLTTCLTPPNYQCNVIGTSFAAPHVSGAAAILRSFNSGWSNSQIRNLLINNTMPLSAPANEVGSGLLDVAAALGIETPLQVSIYGPSYVFNGHQGTWTDQNVSGGLEPYSYQWLRNDVGNPPYWQQVGTGSSYNTVVTQPFELKLEVTDDTGRMVASNIHSVATN